MVDKVPVKTFACSQCGAPLEIAAVGQTVAVACASCGSVVDANDENHQILSRSQHAQKLTPRIALGSMGRFRGANFRVVGMMRRQTGNYHWDEYLLFNPKEGYRWLVEYYGHWSFIRMTRNKPEKVTDLKVTHLGTSFKKFQTGSAKVVYVVGEFFWQVRVGETAKIVDYVCPPEVLSLETTQDEQMWSRGEYVEPNVVQDTFKLKAVPERVGIAPNQPIGGHTNQELFNYLVFFFVVLTVIQVGFSFVRPTEEVYSAWIPFLKDGTEKVKVSPPFELKGHGNVTVNTYAEINNAWVSLDVRLINQESGEIYRTQDEIARYSGSDSDGSWTEGSQYSEAVFPGVKPGNYTLSVEPSADPSITESKIHLRVRRGVLFWGNYFFAIVALLCLPAILWAYRAHFEYQRWEESDYPISN